MSPAPAPEPIVGLLEQQYRNVGQEGNNVAIGYYGWGKDYKCHLWVNGRDYLLADVSLLNNHPFKVLIADGLVYLVYDIPIKANVYRAGDTLELLSSTQFGTMNSRFQDAIVLTNKQILFTWYEQPSDLSVTDVQVGFAYGNVNGWTQLPYSIMPGSYPIANRATIAQVGDVVWYFQISDSRGVVKAIRLLVQADNTIAVDLIIPEYITEADGLMRPEGELPWITAIPDNGTILLAYQNVTYKAFSWANPFCKGANIAVVRVQPDGTKQLEAIIDRWAERISWFAFGINDGHWWLAYPRIDETNLVWNQLWLHRLDGSEQFLGILRNGTPSNMWFELCNTNDSVIASMEDGLTLFNVYG